MAGKAKAVKKTKQVKPDDTPKKEDVSWRKYTDVQVAEALRKSMGLIMRAATSLGCGRSTIRRYIEEYPLCREAKENGHEMLLDDAEIGLHKSIREREGWAICFTLKTLGKERGFVEKQILEHTGKNGGAIQYDDISDTERIKRLLALADIARKRGSGEAPDGAGGDEVG